MITEKIRKYISLTIMLAVFLTLSIGVTAKSGNNSSQNVAGPGSRTSSVSTPSPEKSGITGPESQNTNSPKAVKPAAKTSANTPVKNTGGKSAALKKPVVKTGVGKQLSELGKKLNDIEWETNKLTVQISAFTNTNTTGSAMNTSGSALSTTGAALTTTDSALTTSGSALSTTDSALTTTDSALTTTGSAVSTTGSAIGTAKNATAFVNSTSGKLSALSNRLSAVEKSIKALSGKVDKTLKASYDSLVSEASSIRAEISKELAILKALNTKG